MKRLRLAGIGCGGRTRTYLELAAQMPERYEVVAAADPREERLQDTCKRVGNPNLRCFAFDEELLAAEKLADVIVIGTQDAYHVEPCIKAMKKGYDVLLEKPIATHLKDVLHLERVAEKLGRKVLICHVLRYSPFYCKIKDLVASGILGDIITINADEGIGPFHMSHSYVRGHWAKSPDAAPLIISKSCHDLDIIRWVIDQNCVSVASHGSLMHFTESNAPEGAPKRCTDGCPHTQNCTYNALGYTKRHRSWLQWIMDGGADASNDEVIEWLKTSKWGRCVYYCDNDVADHQTASMVFENGATATFTVSAFSHGRNIEIQGTKGRMYAGHNTKCQSGSDIIIHEHLTGNTTQYHVNTDGGGYDGHGGGDVGLMNALYDEMTNDKPMCSGLSASVESHVIGYAADAARLEGRLINLKEFILKHM